ncbi:MAG: iron export ABC transporter permease subunit FetB [Polyangiaceae bacterium]|nr:iron export ABC transporter permease subunit FetB [Polyangiaceae bacterium]
MSYVEVSVPRLAISLVFIAIAVFVSARLRLGLGSSLAVGAMRAAVQLVAIGYFLVFLFAHDQAWMVLALLLAMLVVAAITSARRLEHGPPARVLVVYALAAIGGGAAVALVPVFCFIVVPHPWFEPRYLVPISGMMLSSAMNVVAQVFERIFASARTERASIEQLLALGASSAQALQMQTRSALRAALIPTINGLVTVGLVALPGMMTGQILSGADPEQAVRYQIVIMYQLVAVAAVSGTLSALFARRMLFTAREQLREYGAK